MVFFPALGATCHAGLDPASTTFKKKSPDHETCSTTANLLETRHSRAGGNLIQK
jgi:hypothetical protein